MKKNTVAHGRVALVENEASRQQDSPHPRGSSPAVNRARGKAALITYVFKVGGASVETLGETQGNRPDLFPLHCRWYGQPLHPVPRHTHTHTYRQWSPHHCSSNHHSLLSDRRVHASTHRSLRSAKNGGRQRTLPHLRLSFGVRRNSVVVAAEQHGQHVTLHRQCT